MIFKPMGGCAVNYAKLKYPVYISIKGDGIRTNVYQGRCRTKSLKPLPNVYTRNLLESFPVLEGLEAELVVSPLEDAEAFNKATSAFMRHKGEPDLSMWVFDVIQFGVPFSKRYEYLQSLELPSFARVLPQQIANNEEEAKAIVAELIRLGYEGAILRHHDSIYKCGKATVTGGELLKDKPFQDAEAVIEGFEEGTHNLNEKKTNELGRSKRSSSKAGKVPSGIVGTILGRHPVWEIVRVSGIKDDLALDMYLNPRNYLGRLFTFKYQDHGTMEAPRIAKFKGFRSQLDMTIE